MPPNRNGHKAPDMDMQMGAVGPRGEGGGAGANRGPAADEQLVSIPVRFEFGLSRYRLPG